MDLIFQVPTQYCSLQHLNLLSPPDTSTTRHHFHFIDMKWSSDSSFLLKLFVLSWSISSSIEHWAEDPQIGEQLYKISSHTFAKVLGHTTDFPTWRSYKRTEPFLPEIWLWRPVGFDYRTCTGLGKQTLGGHKQNLVHTRTQRYHRDLARTVFEHLLWRYGSAVACHRGRGSGCNRPGCGINPLRGSHY